MFGLSVGMMKHSCTTRKRPLVEACNHFTSTRLGRRVLTVELTGFDWLREREEAEHFFEI